MVDFHKRILFSDEAHFWLNGYVNKQNCRIWSEANPQVYVETPLHPEKLTVCGHGHGLVPLKARGSGSLVFNVMDSWLVWHQLEPNTSEDPPCRERPLHVKSVEAQMYSLWCGVEVRKGACRSGVVLVT
ncbi:hypothetical protein TNCV_2356951 [Trichonephila clavipes]|nr:hypothetical protein TNCV_2356951 [Trichonephila clavipes]